MGRKATKNEAGTFARYQCPTGIAQLLEAVNAVAGDVVLPPIGDLLQQEGGVSFQFEKRLQRYLAKVPAWFEPDGFWYRRYETLRSLRRVLFDLADLNAPANDEPKAVKRRRWLELDTAAEWQANGEVSYQWGDISPLRDETGRGVYLINHSGLVSITVTPDGKLAQETNKWVAILLKEDTSRIRACKACRTLFWAERIDRQACDKRCSNRIAQRKKRHGNANQENSQRLELGTRARKGKKG